MNRRNLIALFCIIGFASCSREHRPAGLPDLMPCELTIMNTDGSPLAGATVRLAATEAVIPWAMLGKTDENGNVKIMVNARYAGAPAGKYRVLVFKNTGFDKTRGIPEAKQNTFVDAEAELIWYVHPVYADEKSSPLEIEVIDKQVFQTTLTLTKSIQ
jgi:hypothetical protein